MHRPLGPAGLTPTYQPERVSCRAVTPRSFGLCRPGPSDGYRAVVELERPGPHHVEGTHSVAVAIAVAALKDGCSLLEAAAVADEYLADPAPGPSSS